MLLNQRQCMRKLPHNSHHHRKVNQISNGLSSGRLGLLIAGFFLTFVHIADACSCIYSHPQEHFCSSDFAALITIRAKANVYPVDPLYQAYSIKVHRIYKAPSGNIFEDGYLYAPHSRSSCAPVFTKGKPYIVTGQISDKKPLVSLCNYIEKFSQLTSRQKKGFRRNYGLHCGCKVRDTHSYFFQMLNQSEEMYPSDQPQINTGYCQWTTKWHIENDCQEQFSACVRAKPKLVNMPRNNKIQSRNGINDVSPQIPRPKKGILCQWERNPDFEKCLLRRARAKAGLEREGEP